MSARGSLFVGLLLGGAAACRADDPAAAEVVIVESSVLMESRARIVVDRTQISRLSAATLGDVLQEVPALKVQTNSRGEQVFALRGSDQRQIAVTLDGAPLAAAWDGQPHLNTLPANAIERIAVTRGPASVLQPPSAVAGAVNIFSRQAPNGEWSRSLTLGVGSDSRRTIEAFAGGAVGSHSLVGAIGWNRLDGFEAGGEGAIAAGSDAQMRSALLGWSHDYGDRARTALTLLAVDADHGAQPEMNTSGARYWRYSDLHNAMLIWHGQHPLGAGDLHYSTYYAKGGSRIDQYADTRYDTIVNVEDGRDQSSGGRLIWGLPVGVGNELSLALSSSRSEHLFRERAASSSFDTYTQILSQAAAQWETVAGRWQWMVGSAYERADYPDTGPYRDAAAQTDWAGTSALSYSFNEALAADLTIARRSRFPSLRESYNGALGRFVVNPQLAPETVRSIAAGFVGRHAGWEWELRGFASEVEDGIVRASLPGGRFTRINQATSRIHGVELAATLTPVHGIRARVEGTMLSARARTDSAVQSDRLEYRPGVNLGASLSADLRENMNLTLLARHIADEYGLIAGNPVPQKLPRYTLYDVSLEHIVALGDASRISVRMLLENVTDEYFQTQWNLPGPGRRWSVAATWNF